MFPFSTPTVTSYDSMPKKLKGAAMLLKQTLLLTLTLLFAILAITNFANLQKIGDAGLLLSLTSVCSTLVPLTPLAGKDIYNYKKIVAFAIFIPTIIMLFLYEMDVLAYGYYGLIGVAALILVPAVLNRLKTQKAVENIKQQQEDKYFKQNLL
jgi:hypothetical protein